MPCLRVLQMRLTQAQEAQIQALARSLMGERKAHPLRERGFILRHGQRTARGVLALRAQLTDDASHDEALRVAALFHDVGKGIEPHARYGAALAREALQALLPAGMLEEVCALIAAHCDRRAENFWAQVLQDADILDHFGSVEIGLSFQYGAYTEGGMDETLQWYRTEFAAYAAHVRERLHFDPSRAVFDEKIAFTLAFVRRLACEAAGDYPKE